MAPSYFFMAFMVFMAIPPGIGYLDKRPGIHEETRANV